MALLQSCTSVLLPAQAPPGAVGTGSLQLRKRVRTPLPHVAEQLDQLLHADQLPFTASSVRASRAFILEYSQTPHRSLDLLHSGYRTVCGAHHRSRCTCCSRAPGQRTRRRRTAARASRTSGCATGSRRRRTGRKRCMRASRSSWTIRRPLLHTSTSTRAAA